MTSVTKNLETIWRHHWVTFSFHSSHGDPANLPPNNGSIDPSRVLRKSWLFQSAFFANYETSDPMKLEVLAAEKDMLVDEA